MSSFGMTGIDVQTQTQYLDNESQTSCFHLLLPQPWQIAAPNAWVLAGCPIGFPRTKLVDKKTKVSEYWYARPKEKDKKSVPFVFPSQPRRHANFLFLEENRHVLEPFASLPFEDLEELEPRVAFKAASCGVSLSPTGVISEATAAGPNWRARLCQGLNTHAASNGSSLSVEQSQLAKSNQRNYAAYLGRHRKILTPRCDPLLVVRMERTNAVVLLQRCLRGRAAQIEMAEMRSRVLQLYPELNQLDDRPTESKCVDAENELGSVKVLVGEQLYNLFASVQTVVNSSSNFDAKQDANKQGTSIR